MEGLAALEQLAAEPKLATYPYLAAARAECLAQLGRTEEARRHFERALQLARTEPERRAALGLTSEVD